MAIFFCRIYYILHLIICVNMYSSVSSYKLYSDNRDFFHFCLCRYVCMGEPTYMYIYLCVCICICVYVCTYVCMCMCIYID